MNLGGRDRRRSTRKTRFHILAAVLCSPCRDAFLILSPSHRLSVKGKSRSRGHVLQSHEAYQSRSQGVGAVGTMMEKEQKSDEEGGVPWSVVAPASSASLLTSFKVCGYLLVAPSRHTQRGGVPAIVGLWRTKQHVAGQTVSTVRYSGVVLAQAHKLVHVYDITAACYSAIRSKP